MKIFKSPKLESIFFKDMPLLAGKGTQKHGCLNPTSGHRCRYNLLPAGQYGRTSISKPKTCTTSGPVLPLSVILPK